MEEVEIIPEQGTSAPAEPATPAELPSSVMDVDSAERVKFDGREWSREELRSAIISQSDYTRKMQSIAETRKDYEFYENLKHDLAKVERNPALVSDFKKVYPEKFHDWVKKYESQKQPTQDTKLPPEVMDRLDSMEQAFFKDKVDAFSAQIDAKIDTFSAKYPNANAKYVLADLQNMHDKGEKLTDQAWEKMFKLHHDHVEQLVARRQKEMVTKQKQAHAKAKDTSSGGGIPSEPPVVHKTIKEAGQAYFKSKGWA